MTKIYLESPTEQQLGDDPFDTSIAERAILGPAVEKKGKKLVPLGSAVEVLTGRVQAPTCLQTKRPSTRRQILKEKDLLLGSFDDNANSLEEVSKGKIFWRLDIIHHLMINFIIFYRTLSVG